MAKQQTIELKPIEIKNAQVYIAGDSDLILNKVNARYERELRNIDAGAKTTKEKPNMWEDIITSVRWNIPYPVEDTYNEMNEDTYRFMLQNGKPCISSYGLWKSIGDAVVRNEIDTYATKIRTAVNILAKNFSIPIDFSEAYVEQHSNAIKERRSYNCKVKPFFRLEL